MATLKAFIEKKNMELKALNLYSEVKYVLSYHLSPQAIIHVVALEHEGLLSQCSAETALKLPRETQFP